MTVIKTFYYSQLLLLNITHDLINQKTPTNGKIYRNRRNLKFLARERKFVLGSKIQRFKKINSSQNKIKY